MRAGNEDGMSEEKQEEEISWVRPVLEFATVVIFLGVYFWFRNETVMVFGMEMSGLVFATLVSIPVILTSIALLKLLTGSIPPMQIFLAVMILVFGGLTVWLNDDRFVKIRPTIVYSLFAAILTVGVMTGRSYLKTVMGDQLPMADEGWMKLTKRAILFLAAMAILNEVTWRMFSDDIWVALDKIGQPVMFIGFFLSQIPLFGKYAGKADA
ncbi:MAG: inner membrane-spanning protein YciB [Pseudomonadota bacterium]